MCGIAGYLGNFRPSVLPEFNRIQAHRGPDASGVWSDEQKQIGLAHNRLSIIDLSAAGAQPMWDGKRRACITFNGEIYNFQELRRELERDFAFHSQTDTEVILNLYLRDGVKCLNRLNGIFAFAIWDVEKETLFLARDHLGVKPLYITETTDGFVFASELKALLRAPGVDRSLDPEAIACYVSLLYAPAPRTMFRSVRKLEPGHYLMVKTGRRPVQHQFYNLPYDQPLQDILLADATTECRALLARSVQRQMIADVPVGAFLSGGLDSSAIVALARPHITKGKLQCFTIDFEGEMERDGVVKDFPFAQLAAKELDVDLHTIRVQPSMVESLEELVYQLDEPQGDPAALNALYISQLARKNGIKVLLSGAGGDDIFAGYRRHWALMLERSWSWAPTGLRKCLVVVARNIRPTNAVLRRFTKAFRYADCSPDSRIAGYFTWIDTDRMRQVYGPALRDTIPTFDPHDVLLDSIRAMPEGTPPLNKMLALDKRFFLADHNLNYTDKMAMAAGVEVRVPFLDVDLVAFAARLPVHLKQHGSTGKYVLRKAMEGTLSSTILNRPKTGFGVPLRSWFHSKKGGLLEDVLFSKTAERRGIFDPAGVRKLLADEKAGIVDSAYPLLAIACIEMWLRRFVDQA